MPELLNDVPQANQTLGTTQPLIRTNFSNIDAAFQVDHVGYTLSGQGKHVQVTFPVQTDPTGFPIMPPDIGLISKLNINTAHNELNFVNDSGGLVPFTAGLKNVNGWSYLASGLILKWGAFSTVPIVGLAVTATQGPILAEVYYVGLTSTNTNNYATIDTLSANGFQMTNRSFSGSGSNITFYYFLIGRQ